MATDSHTRTVVVTGAGSGIGRAIALRFADDEYTVVCADIDSETAGSVADEIESNGGKALAQRCDVVEEASVAAMVSNTIAKTGRIDCVAANAGAMVEGGILSLTLADWRRALDVNATGAFLTARAVIPHLQRSKGTLVFTTSTVALAGMKGVAAYSAAKGAIAALTRQLAADFAADGVRVNAVAPGAVRTPLSESQFRARAANDADMEALLSQVIERYPLSRWGRPEEIAEMVHMLGTERSSWTTGQILPIDGGLLQLR
ncbi:MAG: SDR family NAD(P)-dependent oxidoreductase [Rhizobiaceae bacterium]